MGDVRHFLQVLQLEGERRRAFQIDQSGVGLDGPFKWLNTDFMGMRGKGSKS
jgi:hypothetical protein